MTERERQEAVFYREAVARLRALASQFHNPATKIELMEVASRFEKLAERAEARDQDELATEAEKRDLR